MATPAAVLSVMVEANTTSASGQLRKFDASLTRMDKSARTATTSTDKLERSQKNLGTSLATAAKYAASAAGAYIGISQAKAAISTTTDLAKATLTLNKNLGLSVQTASEFAAVAKARGVDTRQLGQSFGTLSRQIEAAKRGTDTAVRSFASLGISARELKRQTPEQTISAVSDGMARLGAGTERTAASMTLFGRGWQTVVPILRDGSGAMKEQLALAEQYGATFSGSSIKSIEDLIATERELKIAQLGLQVQFTKDVAPAVLDFLRALINLTQTVRNAKGEVIDFARKVGEGFKKVWESSRLMRDIVTGILRAIRDAFKGFAQFIKGVVGTISGVLTGDFGKAWRGVKDIFGSGVKAVLALIKGATAPFRAAAKAVGGALSGAFEVAWDKIKGVFESGKNALVSIINWIISNVINRIPGVELGTIGGGGKESGTGKTVNAAMNAEKHARGGKITKPMAIVGEEAPVHPEFVVATNPAYRSRNLGLWAQAGSELGVPGFAKGGQIPTRGLASGALATAGDYIGDLAGAPFGKLPGFMSGTGDWIKDRFSAFIRDKVSSITSLPGKAAAGAFNTAPSAGGLKFALGPYSIPPIAYDPSHAGGNSHVHITGTTTAWIVALGKHLQKMGFLVSEHPAFGGVNFQHSATGGHYDALAIDVNSAASLNETQAEVASIAALLSGHRKGGIIGAFRKGGILGRYAKGGIIGRPLPKSLQKYNRLYAKHVSPDYSGETMPSAAIAKLAEFFGMPGWGMTEIAEREAGNQMRNSARPGAVGDDAAAGHGNTFGYGLWQITTGASGMDAFVNRMGGYETLLNPIANAIVASKMFKTRGFAPWGPSGGAPAAEHWTGDFGTLVRAAGGRRGGGSNNVRGMLGPTRNPLMSPLAQAALGRLGGKNRRHKYKNKGRPNLAVPAEVVEEVVPSIDWQQIAMLNAQLAREANLRYKVSQSQYGILGQAHGGLPFVPQTGTYLLERGEAVVPKEQNVAPNITVRIDGPAAIKWLENHMTAVIDKTDRRKGRTAGTPRAGARGF